MTPPARMKQPLIRAALFYAQLFDPNGLGPVP